MVAMIQADPAKAGKYAQQIVALLVDEDSETRKRAIQAAMMLLGEVSPSNLGRDASAVPSDLNGDSSEDLATFFNRGEDLKPADYANLCAAFHFSRYGMCAFTLEELRAIASDAGVVLPDRLDKTLNTATKNGKKLFQMAGRGTFKPTASAGLVFKERWNVKPGKKSKDATPMKG